MRVLITGGGGFLGQKLAQALLDRGYAVGADGRQRPIEQVTLLDLAPPAPALRDAPKVSVIEGAVDDPSVIARAMQGGYGVVYHLAAVVSGGAEADFDLGMRVNLDGTRAVLEACRAQSDQPRVVFASSVAVYGGSMPPVLDDATALTPQTSYGIQKAIGEMLVADYTRKGFIDGRSVRLPTIVVRPGKPNKAASSFASSILREPLSGEDVICPVDDDAGMWILSPRQAVRAFLRAADIDSATLGHDRSILLPGITVSVAEMLEALARIGGAEARARVRFEADTTIRRIVAGWPTAFNARRGLELGFEADESIDTIIQAFIDDDLPQQSG